MADTTDVIKRINTGTITEAEQTITDLTNGAVLKTIIIGNTTEKSQTVSLDIDGAVFLYEISAKSTLTINESIVCNILKAKIIKPTDATETDIFTLNYHISGIQLGDA